MRNVGENIKFSRPALIKLCFSVYLWCHKYSSKTWNNRKQGKQRRLLLFSALELNAQPYLKARFSALELNAQPYLRASLVYCLF